MSSDYHIRAEVQADIGSIAQVHRAAFGPEEPIPDLVQTIRDLNAPIPSLSFVACTANEQVVGHVMLSHGWLDAPDRLHDILILSPLGVDPAVQRKGIGTALLQHAVTQAKATTAPLLILEGNPKFYAPRGFEPAHSYDIRRPSLRIPEPALQLVRLPVYDASMAGTLVYRDLWWTLDCVGLR